MNSGPTSERAYDVLKQRILAGAFRPGQRLEPTDISRMLEMSITPVRDALHVLVGESLVEARTSNGFHVPLASEAALRDLYAWNAQMLLAAIATWPKTDEPDAAQPVVAASAPDGTDPSDLFAAIAIRSSNTEHLRVVRSSSDRLHAARRAEPKVITGIEVELRLLTEALNETDRASLRLQLNAYHRRRLHNVASLVQFINEAR